MLTIENVDIFGWEAAIRGMRNPMNSWDMSDSRMTTCVSPYSKGQLLHFRVGDNDLALMKKLAAVGTDHGKFLRMINVTLDIVAPLYWYKEFDTYKVGTVANSCSTMHRLTHKPFEMSDFSVEQLIGEGVTPDHRTENPYDVMTDVIKCLNYMREYYLETKDKRFWWSIIQLLPSSYNQRRTVQLNYQVLKAMYHARRNHKLDEWHTFCDWVETLPYFREICIQE